jgi:A-macroglobulin TED domain/Alpha-2-macroglobulin family/MG2 domain/Carboxypeptidase regulatory-like domain/A-macroglobulin receptor binding domain/Alpha-2-macroglobulin bait region domain/Macroglobulin domain MG3
MSRRWLVSLTCLCVLIALLAPLTRARGELKVNEARTRFLIEKEPAEVLLAVENSTGESLNARVELEIRDPQDRVISQVRQAQSIGTGNQTLSLNLPLYFSKLKAEDRRFLWHRLHYRVSKEGQTDSITEGIISLSEITPDLFELRVAATEMAREGSRYKARVIASHPVTQKPAANVRIDGELALQEDEDKNLKLHNSKTTDADGIAVLEFPMPKRFPEFPHTTQPAGGELRVVGKRGAFFAEAEGEALVNQFVKTLVTTDKPLYQPGQMMRLRALLFTPSRHALANQDILFKVDDPEGTTVYRSVVKSSRFGIASTEWSIPDNVRLGDYRIHVMVDGGNEEDGESSETEYDVRISRYDLPNFSVTAKPDRDYYLPGQNAKVRVHADYFFGEAVKRGRVRVVRETQREWNFREQKWDVEEGDEQKGETDANGVFVANLDLSSDHEKLGEWEYRRFEDVTYQAYFTDPTTNRTEQRRFDVRVTREPIHVYIIRDDNRNRTAPLRFFVATAYPDGSPARCNVNITLSNTGFDSHYKKRDITTMPLPTLRTNGYGVAKVSGMRLSPDFEKEDELELTVSAVDSTGRTGKRTEDLRVDSTDMTSVDTGKTIYRPGEPIDVAITSTVSDEIVFVELTRDSEIIRSERVRLHNGRGSVTFPYTPEFKGRITIAAFPMALKLRTIEATTIFYPRDVELKVNARMSQKTYRPGEDAHVALNVRAAEGSGAESALSVVVTDKAVAERYRTTQEFGGNSNYSDSLKRFLDVDLEFAGVTLRDLQRLDTSKVIPRDLDLVAEVMLNQGRNYNAQFFGGDQYDSVQAEVFADLIKRQFEPVKDLLTRRYLSKTQYPKDEASLNTLLSAEKIDLAHVVDPWGVPFRPVFSLDGPSDVLTFMSAGADKRFGTTDDFSVENFKWRYFLSLGATFDLAIRHYHERTGGFIRDLASLREQLSQEGVILDQVRDRWDQPYRFNFTVNQSNYVMTVSSSGPDKVFSEHDSYRGDDFDIWSTSIDYFAETETKIQQMLDQNFKNTKNFPQTQKDLSEVLRNSGNSLEALRDPWNRPYYATFVIQTNYTDRAQVTSEARFGDSPATRVTLTPVTQQVANIFLRSVGPDGVAGTPDDFMVANFKEVLSEQGRGDSGPQRPTSQVVLSGSTGAIHGIVTDTAGGLVPRAKITASHMTRDTQYETYSDEEGKFLIRDLLPGLYEVRFYAPRFMDLVMTHLLVEASSNTEVNGVLQPGQITDTVTVSSSAVETLGLSTAASRGTRRSGGGPLEFRVITKSGGSAITTPHLREYFPETLLWQPSVETDKHGRARVDFKLADNITTWKLAVLGSTENGLIGTAETEIKSFQPFFVEHDPPRVLTEGDEISLPVVVRNYLSQPQKVDLDIKSENWFSLLGPARKLTAVAAGDASRETFNLRAVSSVKDGKQRITATAAGGNDAIEKPVTVHPDGEELSVTDSDVLGSSATVQLNLPENMIPNSNRAELKIYPNLIAHVTESVEAIMQRPYGCGEQVISSTYPSLLLLRYGKSNGEDSPMHTRAERYLSLGYSKLLNYRDADGGFTYWGHGKPDVALTAYALRFLTDASELMTVDEDVISEAQEWLIKQQQQDGSWAADEWNDAGRRNRTAIRTAYVANVLASAHGEESKERTEALKRALDYLQRRTEEIDEPYMLASYALAALNSGDTSRAKPVIEELLTLAHHEGGTLYFDLQTNTPFYGWGVAGRVETTALVVEALTRYCNSPGVKCESDQKVTAGALLFLLKQKDRYGVWYSTQATVRVLNAMLSLLTTQSAQQSSSQATAEIFINDQLAQTIKLPAVAKRLVSPITVDVTKFLRTGKNSIRIKRPEGSPFASVQALASFYGPWPYKWSSASEARSSDLRLQTKCDKTEGKVGDEITCHVEAERVAFRGYGMMLAEIGLPPGADVDRSSLEAANQYDVLPDRVVVYLWPHAGGVKFDLKFRPRFGMNAKSSASVLYDYYNPEARAVLPPATFKIKE